MSLIFSSQDTIAAVATAVAPGQGGIAVIRISGISAEKVGQAVVSVPGRQVWGTHKILYGFVMDKTNQERIDEVLILIMKAPRSFTGEDVVELHCHGGLIAVQRVLERVLVEPGVRIAREGEFTQRAVLNGRIDLTRAEAISELITSRSRRAAEIARVGMDGGIQSRTIQLRQRLIDQLSEIEARVDFEEDLPRLDEMSVVNEIDAIHTELNNLVKDADRGAVLRQGLRVALIGRPNVGKSSLLNFLSRRERSIVTGLPGTTRDLVESEIILEGVPITLLDTAGIRSTGDAIEQLGINRSYEALATADVVVLLFDMTMGWTTDDQTLLEMIPEDVNRLLVANKSDLQELCMISSLIKELEGIAPIVSFSALTGEGEQKFIEALLHICGVSDVRGILVVLNERQRELALLAAKALEHIQELVHEQLPWDFWTIDIRQAIRHLGEITGEELTEAVLDRIFSKFCIGK